MTLEKIKIIAFDLMRWHGLKDWRFEFQDGHAYESPHLAACWPELKKITMDTNYALSKSEFCFPEDMTDEGIIDTILHEIAHAIAPIRMKDGTHHSSLQFHSRGKKLYHGPTWRFTAISIGCSHALDYPGDEEIPS